MIEARLCCSTDEAVLTDTWGSEAFSIQPHALMPPAKTRHGTPIGSGHALGKSGIGG